MLEKSTKKIKLIQILLNVFAIILLSLTQFIHILPNIKSNPGIITINKIFNFSGFELNQLMLFLLIMSTIASILILYNFLLVTYKITNLQINKIKINFITIIIIMINILATLFINNTNNYMLLIPPLCSFITYILIFSEDFKKDNEKFNSKLFIIIFVYFCVFVIPNTIFLFIPLK